MSYIVHPPIYIYFFIHVSDISTKTRFYLFWKKKTKEMMTVVTRTAVQLYGYRRTFGSDRRRSEPSDS